jgi:HEAT repeat protein
MKKLFLFAALSISGLIALEDTSNAHGGTYRGPGDTVPPGGGGGGGGGGPATPGPAGPGAPGPGGPNTPGPGGPAAPGQGPGGPRTPTTGVGADTGPDLTVWQFWWGFNRDPYLNLKSKIHDVGSLTGSDDFFLGHGQKTHSKDSLKPSEETIRQQIVPALKEALDGESNNDIVTACLIALAKIGDATSEEGDSEFEALIRSRLNDSVQEVRETAAVALGILANPESIDLLEQIATDATEGRKVTGDEAGINYRTRAFATFGLGLIGNRTEDPEVRNRIVTTLHGILEDREDHPTRDIRVAALISLGLVPIDPIQIPVKPESELGEDEDLYVLGTDPARSREDQLRYLIDYLRSERKHYLIRAHVPRALSRLLVGSPDELRVKAAEAILVHCGKRAKGQKELRQSAVLALGKIGDLDEDKIDKDIRQALYDSMGDADLQVKNFSTMAIAQLAGNPTEGETEKGLDEIRKHLMTTLSRGKSRVKPWAALAIGVMEEKRDSIGEPMSSDLLGALRSTFKKEGNPADAGAYAIGVGICKDQESKAVLLEKLDKFTDDEARGHMTIGLGLMNANDAIEPIQEIVAKSKYRAALLKSAATSLGLLGDKQVVPQLIDMLRNEGRSLATQAAIASALGFIGDTRSVDPLVEMLQSDDLTDKARAFAAVALGIVADKEDLPWNSKISVDINYRANTTSLTSPEGTGILDIL